MAVILTYTSLVTTVTNYIQDTAPSFVSAVPTFIMLAQRRIVKDSKTLGFDVYTTNTFTAGQAVYEKPARWRNTITFNCSSAPESVAEGNNVRNPIMLRSYEYCRQYWPDDSKTGFPVYYCDYGFNNWLIVPTPDLAYNFEVGYQQVPTLIDDSNETNWITENAPECLIYAALYETACFLRDDARIPVWLEMYKQAISALNAEDNRRLFDRQTNRGAD